MSEVLNVADEKEVTIVNTHVPDKLYGYRDALSIQVERLNITEWLDEKAKTEHICYQSCMNMFILSAVEKSAAFFI